MAEQNTNKRNRWLIPSIILLFIIAIIPYDGTMVGERVNRTLHFLAFFFFSWNLIYKLGDRAFYFIIGFILIHIFRESMPLFTPDQSIAFTDGIADTLGIITAYLLYKLYPSQMDAWLKKLGA